MDYSVIVTLPEHRGNLLPCVKNWTQAQTFPSERFEVLVLSDGAEPALEAAVRPLLRPQDRLLIEPGALRCRLYDWGSREANAPMLLWTESHCTAEPEFLAELDDWFLHHDFDGACCRTIPLMPNAFARMDALVFEEGFRLYRSPTDWRKINVHAFALKRDFFLRAGGLDPQYNLFSEMLLGARLRDLGARLGYASGASVWHLYRNDLPSIRQAVAEFMTDECRYRAAHPGPLGADNLDFTVIQPAWRELPDASLARSVAWTLARHGDFGPECRRAVGASLANSIPPAWKTWWSAWSAEVRCHLWRWSETRLEKAFRDFWERNAHHARTSFLTRERHTAVATSWRPTGIGIEDLPAADRYGFFDGESYNGRAFRWSGPVGALRLPPASAETLELDLGGARYHIEDAQPQLFVNGLRVADSEIDLTRDRMSIRLPESARSSNRPITLCWRCTPLQPRKLGSPDPRDLGLPIFGARLVEGGVALKAA